MKQVSGGNQSDFARKIGCSQSTINRVIKGGKEPGVELVTKICRLEGVDGKLLQEIFNRSVPGAVDKFVIPIATTLLPGRPDSFTELLTKNSIEVSMGLYRPSVYAVEAIKCFSVFGVGKFEFHRNDLVFIDSAIERYTLSLNALNERLCVVRDGGKRGVLSLQEVKVIFDDKDNQWKTIVAASEPKEIEADMRSVVAHERPARHIELSKTPEEAPETKSKQIKSIPLKHILGVAIQAVRNL